MLKEQIQKDLVNSMKEKNTNRLLTLRSIIAAINNAEKEKNSKVDIIQILKTLAKQRKQSMELYESAGKLDLYEVEKNELLVIEEYLPAPLSENDIKIKVLDIINKNNYTIKQMGLIIKEFNSLYPGQDGSVVSKIIKDTLN